MAKVNFYLKEPVKNEPKDKDLSIMLRGTFGRGKQFKRKTGFSTKREFWSSVKGEYKDTTKNPYRNSNNKDLRDLREFILSSFETDSNKGIEINSYWLESTIKNYHNPNRTKEVSNDLITFLEETYLPYVKLKLQNKELSKDTARSYRTILNKIKNFQIETNTVYQVETVDMIFYENFKKYMIGVEKVSPNTFGNYINRLKTALIKANDTFKLNISPDVLTKNFKRTKEKTTFVTLNESEIQKIFEHDFSKSPYLDNARDWLVIGCYIGQRVKDLLSISESNIKDIGGEEFIVLSQSKTEEDVNIPIHPLVRATLVKNGNKFPHSIAEQNLNKYVKTVCQKVGLTQIVKGGKIDKETNRKVKGEFEKWELISSHDFRRSFCTNLYGSIHTADIMSISGHQKEGEFYKYIGMKQEKSAQRVSNFWKETTKDTNPLLKVAK